MLHPLIVLIIVLKTRQHVSNHYTDIYEFFYLTHEQLNIRFAGYHYSNMTVGTH